MPPPSNSNRSLDYDLVVAGGGAAGFYAAITCAECCPSARILILERSSQVLGKVKISGGGRCNVTHACFDPRELVTFYPRGSRQLLGPLTRWGPADTMDWFQARGVPLKTEEDHRVFPESDRSQTIINCLTEAARTLNVQVRKSTAVRRVEQNLEGGFVIHTSQGDRFHTGCFLLTTGGTRNAAGAEIASALGHRVLTAAPSLFTFNISDPRLTELQGLSVDQAEVSLSSGPEGDLRATGPVLVTHWGLSGPAVLRFSAWGARVLQEKDYQFRVAINWCHPLRQDDIRTRFQELRDSEPRKLISSDAQFQIPARLWKRLIESALAEHPKLESHSLRWAHLPKEVGKSIATQLCESRFQVHGKSMNKDEFVTCGGVRLDEVQFKTMESRVVENLFFAGEVLDIDGLTGGFNFQAAWTTGRIAGEAIATAILDGKTVTRD